MGRLGLTFEFKSNIVEFSNNNQGLWAFWLSIISLLFAVLTALFLWKSIEQTKEQTRLLNSEREEKNLVLLDIEIPADQIRFGPKDPTTFPISINEDKGWVNVWVNIWVDFNYLIYNFSDNVGMKIIIDFESVHEDPEDHNLPKEFSIIGPNSHQLQDKKIYFSDQFPKEKTERIHNSKTQDNRDIEIWTLLLQKERKLGFCISYFDKLGRNYKVIIGFSIKYKLSKKNIEKNNTRISLFFKKVKSQISIDGEKFDDFQW